MARESTLIGDALTANRYRASLHRRIYLTTGDTRYASAALPWDKMLMDFKRAIRG